MLTLASRRHVNLSQSTRRKFISTGSVLVGGFQLAGLLRAEAASGIHNSRKAIINIHLDGGPPQMDMIDPKPGAPVEFRGDFNPIQTALTGVQFSELMPQLAACAHEFVFVRSLVGSIGKHHAFQCQSGYSEKDLEAFGGRPAMGCVVSRLFGSAKDVAPAFVDLMQGRPLVRNSARPGFLGPSFQPFRPDLSKVFQRELEAGMKGELARLGAEQTVSLKLNPVLSAQRLSERRSLLQELDRVRSDVDASGMMDALDQFQQQAVGILTSGALADAMNLDKEDPMVVQRYTAAAPASGVQSTTSEGPGCIRKFLLARRLVEAGVRCVSVSISDFDTHSSNFERMRHLLPIVDYGITTLVSDLAERGLLDDVSVVVWGEFGRTPRINSKNGGRDHWPRVGPCILAGGGMRAGQVIGETDRVAGTVVSRPVHYKDVFATLYHNLGIDARSITLEDPQGRPQYLLDEGEVISEVI